MAAFPGPSTLLRDTVAPLVVDQRLPARQLLDQQPDVADLGGEVASRGGRRASERGEGSLVFSQESPKERRRLAAEVGDRGREGLWVASPVDVVGRGEVVVQVAWPVLSLPCALGARRPALVAPVVGLVVGVEDGQAGRRQGALSAPDSSVRQVAGPDLARPVE